MQQLPRLKFFTRNDAPLSASYHRNAALPPRDLFAGNPQILAAYDEFLTLQKSVRDNATTSARKTAEAKRATDSYREAVSAALREGGDPSKIKDRTRQLEAEADAHAQFSRDARVQLDDSARRLGALIQEHGADHFAEAEERMARAAESIEAATATLTDLWGEWAEAWGVRHHLSKVVHQGGANLAYPGGSLPREVTTALQTAGRASGQLADLKAEERALGDWRTEQQEARAANARYIGARTR